jgi:hypothetical protein
MNVTEVTANEQDFPVSLVDLRIVAWPVQCTRVPANLYLRATVVAKADFGDLGYDGDDWQDVYAAIPLELFEQGDVLADLCPSFLVGGIERQETPIGHTDNWGLALDQAPGHPPPVVPPPIDVDAWWQGKNDPRLLTLTFRIRNRGQSQMPDVCLALDALVYRPSVHGFDGPDWHSARFSRVTEGLKRSPVRIGDR